MEDNRQVDNIMLDNDANRAISGVYELCGSNDAILNFGKVKGKKVSDLMSTPKGRSFLVWMIEKEFPQELLNIIGEQWNSLNMESDDGY